MNEMSSSTQIPAAAQQQGQLIRFGHSPDADDAFMFYAIARGKVNTGSLRIEHVIQDIETLNKRAMNAELEATAVSFHAYAHLHDKYAILSSGASFGFHYGPVVVSRSPQASKSLEGKKIAIPGEMTTAFLVLKLYEPNFTYDVVPFDDILHYVYEGKADAGLIIHEGQLTYGRFKLNKVVDLGEWWDEKTGLPLPLGCDVVRKDLPKPTQKEIARILKQSIEYAFLNRGEALSYSQPFARGMDARLVDEFVGMYVNEYTLAYDQRAKKAVEKLLDWGYRAKILRKSVKPEYVEPF